MAKIVQKTRKRTNSEDCDFEKPNYVLPVNGAEWKNHDRGDKALGEMRQPISGRLCLPADRRGGQEGKECLMKTPTSPPCTTRDRDILRSLAEQVARLAQHPREAEKVRFWRALNDLHPERPLLTLWIPWSVLDHSTEELRLTCIDPACRNIEECFRHQLFVANNLPCDNIVRNEYGVSKAIEGANWDYGVPQIDEARINGAAGATVDSQAFTPVITSETDIAKISWPEVHHNEEETARRVAFTESLIGDILPIRAYGVREIFFKGIDWMVRRTGVTEALLAMVDRPEFIHALLGRLTEATLARIDQLEANGLLDASNPCEAVPPGPAGDTEELPHADANPKRYRPIDVWGGASPQIFGEVSPEMHVEFGLRYENQVMSRSGLNYYGCCEPLHNKMEILEHVPRLRKVSISPWCDVAKAAASARKKYVFSHKPNPATLAWDRFDLQQAEDDLKKRFRDSGSMPCEFCLKDVSTIRGDNKRLVDWCNMAWRFVNEAKPE